MPFKINVSRIFGYIKIVNCTQNTIEITVIFENFYLYAYNKGNKLKIVRCIKVVRQFGAVDLVR